MSSQEEIETDEAAIRRAALVDGLARDGILTQPRVAAALRTLPRHLFLPGVPLDRAYADMAIVTKVENEVAVSSCSQPAIIAIMLEQLDLDEGDNVLEIGAGTGYNAALIGMIVGVKGRVTTVDIDEEVALRAGENLRSAGVDKLKVVLADGVLGWPSEAPYDRIIATVGVWDLSPYWIQQLRIGGTLVVPLSINGLQYSIAFVKTGEERLTSRSIRPCGFMRLRGEFAGPERTVQFDGLSITMDNPEDVDKETLRALLGASPIEHSLPDMTPPAGRGLLDYLALKGETLLILADRDGEKLGCDSAYGVMDSKTGIALLILEGNDWRRLKPVVRVFGDESAFLRMARLVSEWETLGRPELARATITAAPLGSLPLKAGGITVRKRWMEYQVDF